nr:RHS repeat-associated core domain-containing protein [Treponema sp. OMZ 792]
MTTYNNFLAKQPAGLIEEVAAGLDKLPFRFTGKELDEETGLYYYGARYLDPKYSRWLSGDPALNDYIPKAPVNDEAKKHNENLPGMGGVFNVINLHVYHYAGDSQRSFELYNPIKYTDPDGRETKHSGKGTIDEPFIQINITNTETDAYKYTSTISYTSYMENGKIFEHYSINYSFLIKDTETGNKLAEDMNFGADIGYAITSGLIFKSILGCIGGPILSGAIKSALTIASLYIGSKEILRYESGMKIEINTELEVVSDSSGIKNSGSRTTNIYKREREDSDGKPILTHTENLNY